MVKTTTLTGIVGSMSQSASATRVGADLNNTRDGSAVLRDTVQIASRT